MAKQYGSTYQPFWAVIDKEGTLLRTEYGPAGEDELAFDDHTPEREVTPPHGPPRFRSRPAGGCPPYL